MYVKHKSLIKIPLTFFELLIKVQNKISDNKRTNFAIVAITTKRAFSVR